MAPRKKVKPESQMVEAHDGTALWVYAEDYEVVSNRVWYAQPEPPTGKTWYACKEGNRTVYLGEFVLALHGTTLEKDQVVLHVDGDYANARIENLRALRHNTALHRRSVPKRGGLGQTGYIGVNELLRKGEPCGRYLAKISVDYTTVSLGIWDNAEDAARSYDRAARRVHGEWARVNFPEE